MKFELAPGCSEADAKLCCEAIMKAEAPPGSHPRSIMPSMNWFATVADILESPLGQAALKEIEALISKGLIVSSNAPAKT
jgi:hypothetical protein